MEIQLFESENQIATIICGRSVNGYLFKQNVEKYSTYLK